MTPRLADGGHATRRHGVSNGSTSAITCEIYTDVTPPMQSDATERVASLIHGGEPSCGGSRRLSTEIKSPAQKSC